MQGFKKKGGVGNFMSAFESFSSLKEKEGEGEEETDNAALVSLYLHKSSASEMGHHSVRADRGFLMVL